MPNRLNIPEDLEQLVEKREKDRRQPKPADSDNSQNEDSTRHASSERRQGPGRRAEDRS